MLIQRNAQSYRTRPMAASTTLSQEPKDNTPQGGDESFLSGAARGAVMGAASGVATAAVLMGASATMAALSGNPIPMGDFAWGLGTAASYAAPAGAVAGAISGGATSATDWSPAAKRNIACATGAVGAVGAIGTALVIAINSITGVPA